MKGYVITLMEYPESVEIADRCIKSGQKFGVDIEKFTAVHKSISFKEMENEGLRLGNFDTKYSNVEAVVGNFVSQYRIWKIIRDTGVPAIVFEHDAVVIDDIPKLTGDIVNLGKPSFGVFNTKDEKGIHPLFSKNPTTEFGRYMPGAHAYYVTPVGAAKLIAAAKRKGVLPCDVFINTSTFPNIMEVYPWPVEAVDSFTTIQKPLGCKAKHSYNDNYKLLS